MCEPTKYHEKRYTVRFNIPIGISRELIRHRKMSFSERSTRYCNYTKDKFENQITFCIPSWADIPEGYYKFWDGDWTIASKFDSLPNTILKEDNHDIVSLFLTSLQEAEIYYKLLINKGLKAQQVRDVLPLATHTELIVTGFASDWKHIFNLRDSSAVHPDMQAIMKPLHKEFIQKGFIH